MRAFSVISRSTTALVMFAALFAAPSLARAQSGTTAQNIGTGAAILDTGTWTVTPFASVAFSGDVDSATGGLGIAAGYNWRPQIAFEAEFSALPSSEAGGFVEVDASVWNLTGNVLYHFAKRPFVPYAVFGLGFGHGSVDVDSNDPLLQILDEADTQFVVNFGGGIVRQVTDGIGIRGDLRYFFGGDLVPDYWRLGVGATFTLGSR